MCRWPLYYYKPVSLQSARTLYYMSAKILWGRLLTCGRLPIGLLRDRDATAAGDCFTWQRRIANPPQVNNLPHNNYTQKHMHNHMNLLSGWRMWDG